MAMYNGCRACSDGQVGIASITITTPGAQLCLNAFPHIKPFWIRATSYLPEHHFLLDGFTSNIKLSHGLILWLNHQATSEVVIFSLGAKVVCIANFANFATVQLCIQFPESVETNQKQSSPCFQIHLYCKSE